MSINYVVTKKVDKTKGEVKVRYYATTRAMQKSLLTVHRLQCS